MIPEEIIKILLAILVGGLIGAEREYRDKAAGFRTIILICVGATLFTIFSLSLGGTEDPVRIAASVVSGVGFLGAGVILRSGGGQILGLTTASTIWLTAALGMGIGGGFYMFSGVAVVSILIVLWFFPFLEAWIDRTRESRLYEVICTPSREKFLSLEKMFKESGLKVTSHKQMKQEGQMICTWEAVGSFENHDKVMEKLFADPEVKGFQF